MSRASRLFIGMLIALAGTASQLPGQSADAPDPMAPPPAADPMSRNVRELQRVLDAGDFPAESQWRLVANRPETTPFGTVDQSVGFTRPGALALSGNGNAAAAGYWELEVPVSAGQAYRITAYYRSAGVPDPQQTIHARIDWRNTNRDRVGRPDYVAQSFAEGEWRRVDWVFTAPTNASRARIQLGYQWCATGTVWWDDIRLSRVSPLPPRTVRAAAVYHRPSGLTPAGNIESFGKSIDQAATTGADIITLPEAVNLIGTGLTYVAAAEPIPGPSSLRLAEKARQYGVYIVAGLIEREGHLVYNTSVLLDRQGQLVGRYRKFYLPTAEVDGGVSPGVEFPVFDTDFGRVGMMICYDLAFTDPARALAARGAELILLPNWGGHELLTRARAAENHLTVVTSSYDSPTGIIDPRGEYVVTTTKRTPVAVADIDLDQVYQIVHLSSRTQFFAERREEQPPPEP